ncbi:MAG TPA: hypothetical protein VFN79_18280 [Steroidobacteraceae bacterium]|nr:hypothetical protein [Steroidobacteraceae bacterium]
MLTGATRLRAIVAAETDRSAADSTPFVADGRTFDVTRKLARNFDSFTWLPDGSGLLLVGKDGTRSVMWEQGLSGGNSRIDLGTVEMAGKPSVS